MHNDNQNKPSQTTIISREYRNGCSATVKAMGLRHLVIRTDLLQSSKSLDMTGFQRFMCFTWLLSKSKHKTN